MDNKYYVYFHKDAETGEILYIGEGCGNRYRLSRSAKRYKELTAGREIDKIIYQDGLSKEDAIRLERELIAFHKPVCNVRSGYNFINLAELPLSEYFIIDNDSPSGLSWIKSSSIIKLNGRRCAGRVDTDGYYFVTFNKRKIKVHRIIVQLSGINLGKFDFVDHIDGNKLNNSLSNLRVSDAKKNARNSAMYSTNTTGVTGVHWTVSNRNNLYASATFLSEDGKPSNKRFPVWKYGLLEAFAMAVSFRENFINNMIASGEYSERHGKRK